MKTYLSYLVLFSLSSTAMAAEPSQTVSIEITGLVSDQGTVFASLCTEQGWANIECSGASLKPTLGTLTHRWDDVPPGEYGITVLHDANNNGEMDFNFFGAPAEQWGSSNNPAPRMGRSLWKDVVFTLGAEPLNLVIRMQPEAL